MIIVIITRRREEAEVQSFVEGIFNEPSIIQQENVPEPNPMTQVGIVHEPIGQFRQGVGIISPLSPDVRSNHLS